MKKTSEEKKLLSKLQSGGLDGQVGNDLTTTGGSTVWTEIRNGEPTRYKQGPGGKFFNGKENERFSGVLHTLEKWTTEDEKIGFLQRFGWLMDDSEVNAYSAKFKPQK